ncbi:hypothetical protein D3C85_1290900 [compost metagenome]
MVVAAAEDHRHLGPLAAVEDVPEALGLAPVGGTHAGHVQHIAVAGAAIVAPGAQASFQFREFHLFIAHVRRGQLQAAEDGVGMAVHQPRHQALAGEVDDLGGGIGQGPDLGVAADLEYLAVGHCHGLGHRLGRFGSEHLAVEQHQVGRCHGIHRGKSQRQGQQGWSGAFHWETPCFY